MTSSLKNFIGKTQDVMRDACKKPIFFIIAGAVLLRLIYFFVSLAVSGPGFVLFPDSQSYIRPAGTLLECGRFLTSSGEIDILRTPGYPVFISFMMLLFGFEYYWVGVVIFQIALSAVGIFALYRICGIVSPGTKAGLIASAAAAVSLLDIRHCCAVLSDCFAQSLSIIGIYFFVKYLADVERQPQISRFAAGCVFMTAALLTRPSFMLLPVCVMVGVAVVNLIARRWKQTAAVILATLLICVTPLGLWCARNSAVSDYDGVTPVSAINLYMFNAAYVVAEQKDMTYYEANQYLIYESYKVTAPEGVSVYDIYNERGKEIILSDIGTYLEGCCLGVFFTYLYPGANDFLSVIAPGFDDFVSQVKAIIVEESFSADAILKIISDPSLFLKILVVGINFAVLAAVFVLALYGVFKADWKRWYLPALLLGTIIYLTAIHCQPVGYGAHARYRISLNLVEYAFFGIGLNSLLSSFISRKKQNRIAGASASVN